MGSRRTPDASPTRDLEAHLRLEHDGVSGAAARRAKGFHKSEDVQDLLEFFGGLRGSVGAVFACRYVFFGALSVLDCLVIGALGGVFGPLGDLCESMLKRAYGVKDSGRVIPGHGGLLDRIDALLFNAPVLYVYVTFVR